jgi:hemerythrin-like domain-containing protein
VKRSAQLAPLSRDHHLALVVARSLARADAASAADAAERFVVYMAEHGLEHFELEEAVLVPFMPDEERGRLLVARLRSDHDHLRNVWRRLLKAPLRPSIDLLHDLGSQLREHVRMEEEELFPYLEGALDPPALQEVADRLEHKRDRAPVIGAAQRF